LEGGRERVAIRAGRGCHNVEILYKTTRNNHCGFSVLIDSKENHIGSQTTTKMKKHLLFPQSKNFQSPKNKNP
jgi:hypothetical protein